MEMMLDTGAGTSLIWRSSAKELNLEILPITESMKMYGAGGADTVGLVSVNDFKLAGVTIPKIRLYAAGRGDMPQNVAGVLGEDFLSKFDLDIDLRSRKVRLFAPKGCNGDQVVYWAKAYFMAKLVRSNSNANWVQANVSLDGQAALAIFDTGAERTVVTTQAVRQNGITPESPLQAAGARQGLAGNTYDTSVAFFRVLTVGQETIQNAKLEIADLFGRDTEVHTGSLVARGVVVNPPDLVIGADFFLAHRVYIARSQGKMYFTYEGGPIFQPRSPEPAGSREAPAL
jgi:predicted aspartyl protease